MRLKQAGARLMAASKPDPYPSRRAAAITIRSLVAWFAGIIVTASASQAFAQVPDPAHSSVPAYIRIGGAQTLGGAPDPDLAFTITCRDFINNPIVGVTVYVDFTNCSDVRLCTAVVGGLTMECASRVVSGVTNGDGQVRMSILGAGVNPGTTVPPAIASGSGSGCIRVFMGVEQLATVTPSLLDQNGALPGGDGVNALDLSILKNDVGASGLGAPYRGRSDYTRDGVVTSADLAALKTSIGNSGLGTGSGAGCAGGGVTQPYCP
jgi:hypothetical protein